jgi:hypothetical protein
MWSGANSKLGAICTNTDEKSLNCTGNNIVFRGYCPKKIEALNVAHQESKVQPNGRETREVMGANRGIHRNRLARDTRNGVGEGEPTSVVEPGDTGEMQGADMEKQVTISMTTAEIEMGDAASNHLSNPAQLGQVLHMDHGRAGDESGWEGRLSPVSGAAG